jgi:hypothetical protein
MRTLWLLGARQLVGLGVGPPGAATYLIDEVSEKGADWPKIPVPRPAPMPLPHPFMPSRSWTCSM